MIQAYCAPDPQHFSGDAFSVVLHDRDALVRRWGGFVDVVAVEDEARSYQSGILMRRRAGSPGAGA